MSYKESIKNIMEANKDDHDMLDFVESRVNSFVGYVQHVSFMEMRMQRLKAENITGEEWRDALKSLDETRHNKHEVVISAVNQLNRLALASDLPLFYGGDVDNEHRNEIGDLCQTVVNEYFEGRYANPLSIDDLMNDTASFVDAVNDLSSQTTALTQ